MSFIYPSLLRPVTTETLVLANQTVSIPKAELRLRRWAGTPITDDLGRKPLVEVAGRPVFAELAVYELFRLSGWEARWLETYGAPARQPKCYAGWLPEAPRSAQPQHPIADPIILALLERLAIVNHNTFAGCWDVLGWYGSQVIFAELKRYKKDRLQATQPRWLAAGLQVGLQPENFLLVEWDFM